MKRILTLILTAVTMTVTAQIQPTLPKRSPSPNMVQDSAWRAGQILLPTGSTLTLGAYADRPGQSFKLRTSNNRLSVRGTNQWLEFPSFVEVQSMIATIPTFNPSLYYTKVESDARFPLLSGSYVNPSWITSLPYSKITGAPSTTTPTLQQVTNAGNISSNGILITGVGQLTGDETGLVGYYFNGVGSIASKTSGTTGQLNVSELEANLSFNDGKISIIQDPISEAGNSIGRFTKTSNNDLIRVKGAGAIATDEFTTLGQINTLLSTKQNSLTLTTTGTSGAATLVGNILNIPQYGSGGGGFSGDYNDLTNKPNLTLYELLSNKSSSTSLGTSNTLYPTQNAVKTYVDGLISGISDDFVTLNGNDIVGGYKTFTNYITAASVYANNTTETSGGFLGADRAFSLNALSTDFTIPDNSGMFIYASPLDAPGASGVGGNSIRIKNNAVTTVGQQSKYSDLVFPITDNRRYSFPNASGTIALTSDFTNYWNRATVGSGVAVSPATANDRLEFVSDQTTTINITNSKPTTGIGLLSAATGNFGTAIVGTATAGQGGRFQGNSSNTGNTLVNVGTGNIVEFMSGSTPTTKTAVLNDGSVQFNEIGASFIIKSPNGTSWKITISDAGVLTTTALP